jgi:hypothetical protein
LNRLAEPQSNRVPNDANLRIAGGQQPGHVGRVVGRAVVQDAQLETPGGLGKHFENLGNVRLKLSLGVINRQQHTQRIQWTTPVSIPKRFQDRQADRADPGRFEGRRQRLPTIDRTRPERNSTRANQLRTVRAVTTTATGATFSGSAESAAGSDGATRVFATDRTSGRAMLAGWA